MNRQIRLLKILVPLPVLVPVPVLDLVLARGPGRVPMNAHAHPPHSEQDHHSELQASVLILSIAYVVASAVDAVVDVGVVVDVDGGGSSLDRKGGQSSMDKKGRWVTWNHSGCMAETKVRSGSYCKSPSSSDGPSRGPGRGRSNWDRGTIWIPRLGVFGTKR